MVVMTGSDPEKAKNVIQEKNKKSADKQFGRR
jgi:hypothetical protein